MTNQRKPRPDADTLRDMYLGQQLSMSRMAAILNIDRGTVRQWLIDAGIPIQNRGWSYPGIAGRHPELRVPPKLAEILRL